MSLKLVLLLAFIFFTSGCVSIAKYYEADPIFKQQEDLLTVEEGWWWWESDETIDIVDIEKLNVRIKKISERTDRNKLIFELISISDRVCSLHNAAIVSNVNTWNVATGTLTNIFSALGTVLGGVTTKASLAAAATVSSSTQSLVNEEVFLESVGSTIVRAISIARKKEYAKIRKKMRESYADYSMSESMRDIQEYHRRCSFYYGLLEVSKSLDQRKKTKAEIDNDIDRLKEHLKSLRDTGVDPTEVEGRIKSLLMDIPDAAE